MVDLHHIHRWIILVCVLWFVFAGSALGIAFSAFPSQLAADLNLSAGQTVSGIAVIIIGFLIAYLYVDVISGALVEQWGYRRVYGVALSSFAISCAMIAQTDALANLSLQTISVWTGFTTNFEYIWMLIGAILVGAASGMVTGTTLSLIMEMFYARERALPIGITMQMDVLGFIVGSAIAGVLVGNKLPWQWLFSFNILPALIILAILLYLLPKNSGKVAEGNRNAPHMDYIGALTMLITVVFFSLALTDFVGHPEGAVFADIQMFPQHLAPALIISLIAGITFILVELHSPNLLLDPRAFVSPLADGATLVILLVGFAMFIALLTVPLLINIQALNGLGFSAFQEQARTEALRLASLDIGITLLWLTLPMSVAGIVGGFLSDRFGTRLITTLALFMAAIGFALFTSQIALGVTQSAIAPSLILIGLGIGTSFSPSGIALTNAMPKGMLKKSAPLIVAVRLMGLTVGMTVLQSWGSYRINELIAQKIGTQAENAPISNYFLFFGHYANANIQVIQELAMLGGLICAFALLISLFTFAIRETLLSSNEDGAS